MTTLFDLAFHDDDPPAAVRPGRVLNIRRDGIVADAIYIGSAVEKLGLPDSEWRNPFRVGADIKSEDPKVKFAAHVRAVAAFAQYLDQQPDLLARIHELHDRDLLCWCSPYPCHGETLRYRAFRAVRRLEAAR